MRLKSCAEQSVNLPGSAGPDATFLRTTFFAADMADGIGGGMTVERRLSIMKDSRIGTYGAATLIMF